MTQETHIRVYGLRVLYGETEVLHGIDFTVKRGEFVSIIGQSGCGKSTLLHALAGFIEKKGEAQVPTNVGIVFQNYAVFPWLTVKGNIAFGLDGIKGQQRETLIARLLEIVGLSADAHKYPAQLSGGQTQRVALARALAPDPEVILMDEPFGALDLYTREKMQTWLLNVWEENHKTVLFVTHNIEEAIFLSDRVIVLGEGRILGEFSVPFKRPRIEDVKFEKTFVDLKRKILDVMENRQLKSVRSLSSEEKEQEKAKQENRG